MQKMILASASPRRKQILEMSGIPFEVIVSGTKENFPVEMTPEEAVVFIAQQKAQAVQRKLPADTNDYTIIGADTIVVLEGKIQDKPSGYEEAHEILSKVSGKTHSVITGVHLLSSHSSKSFFEKTEVSFNSLTSAQIDFYIRNYQPFDKAGAYAIQEWIGAVGIREIRGDYYNVVGLPVNRLLKELFPGGFVPEQ